MEAFIKNLAKGAGEILKDGFGKKLDIRNKPANGGWVTQYDLLSDKYIIDRIRKKFPYHGIMTEESGHLVKKKDFWIVDPLDGTGPFATNSPTFAVSICFVSDNQLKYGAVYQPITDEMFFANNGRGAFLNNSRISISERQELKFARGYMWMHTYNTSKQEKLKMYHNIVQNEIMPLSSGAAAMALCFTACGRFDFVATKGLYPWDYTAGVLILKEAGAKVTEFKGKPYNWKSNSIVAANPVLHKKIMDNFKF